MALIEVFSQNNNIENVQKESFETASEKSCNILLVKLIFNLKDLWFGSIK